MPVKTALDVPAYFDNVVITFLLVVTFLILVLAFLYMIYGRQETTAPTTTAPKPKGQI